MSKIEYVQKKLQASSLKLVAIANDIIEEYQRQGYQLTLRQLYYQFVARDIIANKQTEYKRLGSILNDARLAGLIDWDAIEDRTRNLRGLQHYEGPKDFLLQMTNRFHLDTRRGQETHLEVWIEKDALVGVIERVCLEQDVRFFACRGYVSQSEQHSAALRYAELLSEGHHERVVILHLGDHDPSGIDMTRDIEDRMKLFLSRAGLDPWFSIQRLALNMDQVEQYNPPPNPAKLTDSRCGGYIEKFGESSWELDALSPRTISYTVKKAILHHTDEDTREARLMQQSQDLEQLREAAERFEG